MEPLAHCWHHSISLSLSLCFSSGQQRPEFWVTEKRLGPHLFWFVKWGRTRTFQERGERWQEHGTYMSLFLPSSSFPPRAGFQEFSHPQCVCHAFIFCWVKSILIRFHFLLHGLPWLQFETFAFASQNDLWLHPKCSGFGHYGHKRRTRCTLKTKQNKHMHLAYQLWESQTNRRMSSHCIYLITRASRVWEFMESF